MTVSDAIARADELHPNTYSEGEKYLWLTKCDRMIIEFVINTHCTETIDFSGYDPDEDADTELIAPSPFDSLYIHWLDAQINLANGEYERYNASITLYNTEYEGYAAWYNRNNAPKPPSKRRFRF